MRVYRGHFAEVAVAIKKLLLEFTNEQGMAILPRAVSDGEIEDQLFALIRALTGNNCRYHGEADIDIAKLKTPFSNKSVKSAIGETIRKRCGAEMAPTADDYQSAAESLGCKTGGSAADNARFQANYKESLAGALQGMCEIAEKAAANAAKDDIRVLKTGVTYVVTEYGMMPLEEFLKHNEEAGGRALKARNDRMKSIRKAIEDGVEYSLRTQGAKGVSHSDIATDVMDHIVFLV